MIKPIAEIHHKPGKRSIVYADDYNRLLKYCDQLQAEKVALADLVGQYSKLSNDSDEIESIKSS